jgi:hypothetical protein
VIGAFLAGVIVVLVAGYPLAAQGGDRQWLVVVNGSPYPARLVIGAQQHVLQPCSAMSEGPHEAQPWRVETDRDTLDGSRIGGFGGARIVRVTVEEDGALSHELTVLIDAPAGVDTPLAFPCATPIALRLP